MGASPASAADLSDYPGDPGDLYLTVAENTTLPKLGGGTFTAADEDIVYFHAAERQYELFFDGSDVGLSGATIDAVEVTDGFFLSFTSARSVSGISGTVDDSDIVRFEPASLGSTTAGTFFPRVDGSEFGLTSDGEDIDAFSVIDDRFFFSTTGDFSIPTSSGTVSGQDEDIFECMDDGCDEGAKILLNFTASGLSSDSEDVDAFAMAGGGTLSENVLLSTTGSFSAGGLSAANEDVVACDDRSSHDASGITCTGSKVKFVKYFDGNTRSIDGNVTGVDWAFEPGSE